MISEKIKQETVEIFERICEILDIPRDAISFEDDGDRYAIYCEDEYIDKLGNFFDSIERREIVKE